MTKVYCDNNCDHGCYVDLEYGRDNLSQILDAGWVVLMWNTQDMPLDHHDHHMIFCDALCAYKALRIKLLHQHTPDNYANLVARHEAKFPADIHAHQENEV